MAYLFLFPRKTQDAEMAVHQLQIYSYETSLCIQIEAMDVSCACENKEVEVLWLTLLCGSLCHA